MKKTYAGRWLVAVLALFMCVTVAGAQQDSRPPAFTQQELDQMLAPIALYPDSLLSQILMAATYPDDVVDAAQWSRHNSDLNGERAVRAVDRYDWDPSVKSLVAFPQILDMMDAKINWTEDLGDAFLDQQAQVMDTVQYLRRQAYAAGNLRSSDQYRVDMQDSSFVIEFANPEMACLPYYNPVVVYGTWWWPTHQPVYWAPWPGYYARAGYRGYAWGPAVPVGRGFFYSAPDWQHRRVNIVNVNNYYYRSPSSRADAPRTADAAHVWQHDAARRRDAPQRYTGWSQPAARVESAPEVRRDMRPAPAQPVVSAPAPVATRAESVRGYDSRSYEVRSDRAQGRDMRAEYGNRAAERGYQPTAAAPVAARAPVVNPVRAMPAPLPVPTPPPVAASRPNAESRISTANAGRTPDGTGRRIDTHGGSAPEQSNRPAPGDNTVAAAPSGNSRSGGGNGNGNSRHRE